MDNLSNLNKDRYFVLTSKAGRFIFKRGTIMSHAKLVRDTITASVMGVLMGVPRIHPKEDPMAWIHNHIDGPVKYTVFGWVPAQPVRKSR